MCALAHAADAGGVDLFIAAVERDERDETAAVPADEVMCVCTYV